MMLKLNIKDFIIIVVIILVGYTFVHKQSTLPTSPLETELIDIVKSANNVHTKMKSIPLQDRKDYIDVLENEHNEALYYIDQLQYSEKDINNILVNSTFKEYEDNLEETLKYLKGI